MLGKWRTTGGGLQNSWGITKFWTPVMEDHKILGTFYGWDHKINFKDHKIEMHQSGGISKFQVHLMW